MKVTAGMKVKDALKINGQMLEAFVRLAPELERAARHGIPPHTG